MKYRVTVLTPTLVGDGNKLAPIDYMVWRDQINVLDQNRIFKLLSKGPRLEGYLTQLVKRLSSISLRGAGSRRITRAAAFRLKTRLTRRIGKKLRRKAFSIPTFAASGRGPFLPGAAIKGALRTAWILRI